MSLLRMTPMSKLTLTVTLTLTLTLTVTEFDPRIGHVKNVSPNQLQPSGNPKLRRGVCEVTVGFESDDEV